MSCLRCEPNHNCIGSETDLNCACSCHLNKMIQSCDCGYPLILIREEVVILTGTKETHNIYKCKKCNSIYEVIKKQ